MTPVSGLLGLASRAGQIILGADLALREIKSDRAGAVLLDAGASEGTCSAWRQTGITCTCWYPCPLTLRHPGL